MDNRKQILQTIQELSSTESYNLVYHKSNGDVPMPSVNALAKIVETIQEIIFPGYVERVPQNATASPKGLNKASGFEG